MSCLALISCGKSKGPVAAPCRSLYIGAMFKKSLAFAEHTCDRAVVLSAKYGLVELDTVIEPYEQTLNKMSRQDCAYWAQKVAAQIKQQYPGWDYVYLAGANYMQGLPKGKDPMSGLSFGRRLAWLNQQLSQEKLNVQSTGNSFGRSG